MSIGSGSGSRGIRPLAGSAVCPRHLCVPSTRPARPAPQGSEAAVREVPLLHGEAANRRVRRDLRGLDAAR